MPTFLGTLTQSNTTISLTNTNTTSQTSIPTDNDDNQKLTALDPTTTTNIHFKGRPIASPLHVVLSSITAGLHRPNVLDLKLGARLWDDATPPAKRARLDAVAHSTTSGSLGFRVAGMRVWEGERRLYSDAVENGDQNGFDDNNDAAAAAGQEHGDGERKVRDGNEEGGEKRKNSRPHPHSLLHAPSNFRFYNKLYGRTLSPGDSLKEGLRRFVLVPEAHIDTSVASKLMRAFCDEVREIREVLERTEMRMFSGSILIAYEGDGKAFKAREEELTRIVEQHANGQPLHNGESADDGDGNEKEEDQEEEDDDEEEEMPEPPVLYRVKLIDFAHAQFTPGLGVDENVLQGVRSVERIFGEMCEELLAEGND
jgi:1D-myo-inositol-tetrakisphosphate 5-kinase/inositol-polyphosphate multikinase